MIYNRIPWRSATGTDPNYKFYVRCRTKYAAAHNLPRKSEAKEGSAATLVGQNPEGKESKTDLSRSNSAQIPREKEIKSHKVSASVGGSESTSFPMLDHLPSGPRNLIFRMLDPNPETRISIDDVRKDSWFRNVVKSHLGEGWCSLSEEGTERGLRERPGAAVTCVAGKESGSSRDRQREGSSSGSGSGSLSVSRSGSGGIARSGSGSLTRPKEERNEVVAGSGAVPAQAVPK